ncbi:cell division protein FtsQ/DivIB [Dyella sp. A6]|uniref:cell division protein FtsQ/DivIB n=1 Tax=Dyella aluminiiresistens TaxID=3069105 RepID=UPI002E75F91F|nr:cell division protein FtsQ/DivIB [Dyella sp. A6]
MKGSYRLVAWCLAVALVALPIVGVLNGWFAASRWPVTRLTVQAEFHHVSAEQLRAVVLPHLGKGFFAMNLDKVQRAVAALPWVASVEASKRWPDTLLLRVVEREPFARWNGDSLIDRRGEVFKVADASSYTALPDLHGPADQMSDVVGFYADALKMFAGTSLKVAGVTLSDRGSWTLTTASGASIVLGDSAHAGARLRRFLGAYAQVMAGHTGTFVYADLRYTNGFAVKWPTPAPGTAASLPRT